MLKNLSNAAARSANVKSKQAKVKNKPSLFTFYFLLFTSNYFLLFTSKSLRLCVLALICLTFSACQKPEVTLRPISKVTTLYGVPEKIGEPFGVAVKIDEVYVSDGESGKI